MAIHSHYPHRFFRTFEEAVDATYKEMRSIRQMGDIRPLGKPKAVNKKKSPSVYVSIVQRSMAIQFATIQTAKINEETIREIINIFAKWMEEKEVVRVIGAGRALIAATIPANRLAHGGARISVVGGLVPLPNTAQDGAILAASASGKTQFVLQILETAKSNNPRIELVGIADKNAEEFRNLCDHFIGIDISTAKPMSDLFALADLGEYVISELLDALVVAAGDKIGLTEEDWKLGHEELGPTGPDSPEGSK